MSSASRKPVFGVFDLFQAVMHVPMPELPPFSKTLLEHLVSHSSHKYNFITYVSEKTLATEMNRSERSVRDHLDVLEQANLIHRKRRYRNGKETSCETQINWPRLRTDWEAFKEEKRKRREEDERERLHLYYGAMEQYSENPEPSELPAPDTMKPEPAQRPGDKTKWKGEYPAQPKSDPNYQVDLQHIVRSLKRMDDLRDLSTEEKTQIAENLMTDCGNNGVRILAIASHEPVNLAAAMNKVALVRTKLREAIDSVCRRQRKEEMFYYFPVDELDKIVFEVKTLPSDDAYLLYIDHTLAPEDLVAAVKQVISYAKAEYNTPLTAAGCYLTRKPDGLWITTALWMDDTEESVSNEQGEEEGDL